MVSSVAAAISEIALDAAAHRLDSKHYPHLRHVALAHTWASVGAASCLGYAAGIRMRGNRCRNDRFAPGQPIGRPAMLNGSVERGSTAILTILCIQKAFAVI
jgi:hypothetical protein